MDDANFGNMTGIYRQYSADDLRHMAQVNNHQHAMMGMIGSGSMANANMMGGQTLDEIIQQNNKELQRRRSYQTHPNGNRYSQEIDTRRASMLEFGSSPGNTDLESFQFDPSPVPPSTSIPRVSGIAQRRLESQRARRSQPGDSLALNTQFQPLTGVFGSMTQSPVYQQPLSSEPLDIDVTGSYMPQSMSMDMDYTVGLDTDHGGDMTPLNVFSHGNFSSAMTTSPIHHDMPNSLRGPNQDPGGGQLNGEEQVLMDKMPNMNMSDPLHVSNGLPPPSSLPVTNAQLSGNGTRTAQNVQEIQDFNTQPSDQQNNAPPEPVAISQNSFSTGEPMPNTVNPPNIPQYRNAYSSSGFDMLGVLMRVATRPKPAINIGAVDMSCAFVVCDVTQYDLPIVYCSDIFERLTGYTKHEILGRNCRFLQAPDGKVKSGVKRKYVDDQAVLHLKNMISQRQEAQISLINYRKGGQPFMNLLTMIPIAYDTDEIKYYVGFQVDLVEQPTSITNKNPGKH